MINTVGSSILFLKNIYVDNGVGRYSPSCKTLSVLVWP